MSTTIDPDDVYWEMTWNTTKFPEKQPKEMMFEDRQALAVLLADEVLFLNNFHWEEDWPERAKEQTSLNVNCSDVFYWGCADAEELSFKEIQSLYDHWLKDKGWEPAVWCIKKRKQTPQKPVLEAILKCGIWPESDLVYPEVV
jgi:hypothetical protein